MVGLPDSAVTLWNGEKSLALPGMEPPSPRSLVQPVHKCTPVQALSLCTGRKAHKGSRGVALIFLDHGTRTGEWSASRPGRSLPPGKTRYPLYRRLGGPQGRSGQVRKISSPPRFDPRTVQPVASRYTDNAVQVPYHKAIPTKNTLSFCNFFRCFPDTVTFSYTCSLNTTYFIYVLSVT